MSEVNTDKLIEDLRAVVHDAEELLRAPSGAERLTQLLAMILETRRSR